MSEAAQQLVAAIVVHDGLGHHRAKARHAFAQPPRYAAAVQRQIGASSPSCHVILVGPWLAEIGFSSAASSMIGRL
ncbi:MAG TPA: hypothetical protein VHN20_18950 [Beijerinckiaceae bacterium]|nr:hypothetical protein [Beijerinckiaceae bacterium]